VALADVGFEIVDHRPVRAVLHEALFLRGEKLLNLRGGVSVGFRERGSRGVQRGFALFDVRGQVVDNGLVGAVLDQALRLRGGELLELLQHGGHLQVLRVVLQIHGHDL